VLGFEENQSENNVIYVRRCLHSNICTNLLTVDLQ